jgi:small subunit ribosomal protein S2
MPFVTERWLGGMLTNFTTVRKSLKKMQNIDKMFKDPAVIGTFTKKEQLMMTRERDKLERVLGGITDLNRLPAALFVIDVKREHIAVAEAHRLGIPVIGIVDTNSNPYECEYPIPANDDAFKSIALITKVIGQAIEEAYADRKRDKEEEGEQNAEAELAGDFLAAASAPADEATEFTTSEATVHAPALLEADQAELDESPAEGASVIAGDATATSESSDDKPGSGESYA